MAILSRTNGPTKLLEPKTCELHANALFTLAQAVDDLVVAQGTAADVADLDVTITALQNATMACTDALYEEGV
jgi:hypothetical protein